MVKDVTFSGKNFLSPKQGTQPILKWKVKDVTTHTEAAGERCNVYGLKFSKSKTWDPTHTFQVKDVTFLGKIFLSPKGIRQN